MKRFAILMLAATAPASAQDSNTQCRWVGSTWSCDSQQSAPNDYLGAMGGAGPDHNDTVLKQQQIQMNRNALEMQEAQLRAMKKAEEGKGAARGEIAAAPQPPRRSLFNAELMDRIKAYVLTGEPFDEAEATIAECRLDAAALIKNDPVRTASPKFNGNNLSEEERIVYRKICQAHASGVAEGISRMVGAESHDSPH